jgi:catechol 2,3-dioxygenase
MTTNTVSAHPLAGALSGLRIASVELGVASLDRSIAFYSGILGLRVLSRDDDHASLGTAGAGELLRLVPATGPAPARAAGLYHTAFRYPTRADLADALARLVRARYPLTGASDHAVSEALYLDDPDGHGVELMWDRDRALWPYDAAGNLQMGTAALDAQGLLNSAPAPVAPDASGFAAADDAVDVGHVHLKSSDLQRSLDFYVNTLGLDLVLQFGAQAGFVSVDGYHHHLGMNTWESAGGSTPPPGSAALRRLTLQLRDADALASVAAHFAGSDLLASSLPGTLVLHAPDGLPLELLAPR